MNPILLRVLLSFGAGVVVVAVASLGYRVCKYLRRRLCSHRWSRWSMSTSYSTPRRQRRCSKCHRQESCRCRTRHFGGHTCKPTQEGTNVTVYDPYALFATVGASSTTETNRERG